MKENRTRNCYKDLNLQDFGGSRKNFLMFLQFPRKNYPYSAIRYMM